MEMEPFSSNHKRGLTRSRSLPPRMEIGDSSNIGYGQFSAEVVDTSRIKSHSQEISSQTDPHMDRFLSDDLENNKDSLEKSYPKDRFQETIPPSEYPIGENMSAIEGRAPDLYPLNRENSSVIEQDQGEFYAAPPSIRDVGHQSHSGDCPRRRRPVSPPLRSRFEVQDYAEYYAEGYAGPYYYVYDDIAATSTTYTTSTTATTSADDFENDNNANTANLARPKPGDIKNTNQETLSKEKDNRAISAQLDDVNYTRASNVTLSNFVSVKLSGKSNYDMWKAQMVCLMKSHKMRGLVIKDKELPDNKDTELRERYEILLNGWLIGSLSEEIIKDKRIYNKGAKGIWDTLEQSYDPYAISPTASTLLKPREEKEKQGTGIELKLIKKLHNATLEGHWWKAKSILNECQGAATWEINVNHDTLLHVAVRLGNNYFLEKMLDIIQTEKEIEKANSEGHTALHTAAIVGNKEAAELLVEKNKKLLSMKDNDSKIPLACANLNKQVNVFVYLWRVTDESDRKGSLSENKEKENENEKDKDKRKEKENEEEKEKEEGKLKENEKENQIKKEKEIENENENEKDKRKERVNEKEKRIEEGKEDENEKEKGKKEGKGNEIEKEKGKGIVNKNEKVKEEEQEGQVQSLLNTAIHDKQYDLAMELVKIYPNLAKQPSTLVVLTRNFPSQISFGETLMYPSLNDVCHKLVKRSFLLLHSLEYLYARAGETLWKMRRAVRDNKTEKPKLYGFRRFKNKYYYSLFPELVISFFVSCAVPAAVLYLIYRLLCLLILLLRLPFSMLYFILWKVLAFLVVPIKNIEKKRKEHKEAKKFLKLICRQNSLKAKNSKDSPFDKFYKESLMEAACLDVHEVLDQILKLSSNAMKVKNKDGHNIIQLAVINRSAEVYNLLTPIIEGKGSYRKVMDVFRNNLLHLAGRLAPLAVLSCTSGAALQLQRELQWREEVKKLMEPTQHTKENVDYETPEMVFSREHANLVKEGEKWMKTTAESCSITAALIITIVFAAAITVPGGSNQVTGIPLFKRKFAFNIFAVADAISLFLASTSLLVFLSILTTRFAEKDFLISLPRRLFIGLCLLFLSTTAMMLAFSTILFLVFCEERPWMLTPLFSPTMSSTLVPLTSTFTSFPSKQFATSTNSQFISKARTNQTHGFKVSCNASPEDNENQLILPETQKLILPNNVDRRNLLVGLGGLYTAASLTSLPSAFASPITAPDITNVCKDSASGFNTATAIRTGKCCPPSLGKKVKPFTFPRETKTRVRWPAHLGTKQQVDKYLKAIAAMRALPDDHPHSFASQAKIHCAYCNGGYTQVDSGFPDIDIQIHNSWLFFPFHRWYLYFYERILGNLINDPTFALPYWNWDDPVGGMTIPDFFLPENSPAYDVYRDARHKPPLLVDLAFDGSERDVSNEVQKQCNLSTVYRDLVRNGTDSKSFFGGEYVAGDAPVANGAKSIGSVEAGTHTAVHRWVGDSTQPNNEDMGNFYSAGYDPVFYIHHSNVDRMWKLWKDLGIKGHNEPRAKDWLDASYVFYDENEDLVRVYNKDCVNLDKLNYEYFVTKGEIAWRKSRPGKRNKNVKRPTVPIAKVKTVEQLRFPVGVDPELKVRVKRPAVNRTEAEKAQANEILMINGIRFNSNKFVKFDVFVNDNVEDGTLTTPCDPEYAGGFSQVPHNDNMKMLMTSAARFGLDEILEDTNTEGEEYALVTLVARAGCDDVTVADIRIELVPIED